MRIDNFITARCKECGWVKQFHPGREYDKSEFQCDCKEAEDIPEIDILKGKATKLNIKYPANIGVDTLKKKIKEVING